VENVWRLDPGGLIPDLAALRDAARLGRPRHVIIHGTFIVPAALIAEMDRLSVAGGRYH
jgi:hypothetical protein